MYLRNTESIVWVETTLNLTYYSIWGMDSLIHCVGDTVLNGSIEK